MEYETRSLKWYWVGLFITYVFAVTYFLFKANPYLYSQATLKSRASSFEDESVHPQPRTQDQFTLATKPNGSSSWPYLTASKANVASDVSRGKTYKEHEIFDLKPAPSKDMEIVGFDTGQVFVLEPGGVISGYKTDGGERQWRYQISKEHLPESNKKFYVLTDSALVYLALKNGRLLALEKNTGRPQWLTELDTEVLSKPWLSEDFLVVGVLKDVVSGKGKKGPIAEFLFLNRSNGSIQKRADGFEHKSAFIQVPAPSLKMRIFFQGNKVFAINENKPKTDFEVAWSANLAEEVLPYPVIFEHRIFLTTQTGRLIVLDAAKKGLVETEMDLEGPLETELMPIPLTQRMAYLHKNGTLRVVDLQKNQGAWKYDLNIRGPVRQLWSARLKGAFIQEFGMNWAHKGWTIWAPCGSKQFCIYNPEKGQLINRIELSGEPIALPLVFDRKLIAPVKKPTGEVAISHLLEPSEIKRVEGP